MKVKRIIHHIDGETMHWEVCYNSEKIIDMPYIVGKFQSIIEGFNKTEEIEIKHSLFNESKIGRIELPIGKNELYYLTAQPKTMLSGVYCEPESLSLDIYVSEDYDCFIYSFYNNTESPNISIVATMVDMDERLFNKLKSNLGDLAYRQYILKKMLGKSSDKEVVSPLQSNGKKNLTIEEAAEYLNIAKGTIYNWVSDGKIPNHKTGGKLLFIKSEIDEWIVRESRHHKK